LSSFFLTFLLDYLWWGKLEWKVVVPWFLVMGQWKMLVDFVMVIKITSILGTWQNK